MGLDTYLEAHVVNRKTGEEVFNEELCYWRKCWNVRSAIYSASGTYSEDEYRLNFEQTIAVFRALSEMNNEKDWDDDYRDGMTIWNYESYRDVIQKNIERLDNFLIDWEHNREDNKYKDCDVWVEHIDSY